MNNAAAILGRLLAVLAVWTMVGCGGRYISPQTPHDEAMLRAIAENKSPEQAAQEYFLPSYYYDPQQAGYDGQENADYQIGNYFRGMDQIAVQPSGAQPAAPVDPLAAPVYQLLDHHNTPNKTDQEPDQEANRESNQAVPAADQAPDQRHRLSLPEVVLVDPVQTNQEILGRNTWMIWCGGNEGFWDWLASDSLGFIDLLKLLDSRQRATRFDRAGLINEPQMMQSGAPDAFGLWLDIPVDQPTRAWRDRLLRQAFEQMEQGQSELQRGLSTYRGEPYEPSTSAPYDRAGTEEYRRREAEAKKYPPPEIYGFSSGVVGLRLFPNPNFDAEARRRWDGERYYSDHDYYSDPDVVRPFRVGMACAFCHASFHPLNPPRDEINPGWENISGNIGAQYLRVRAVFSNLLEADNFVYHILDSQPPGTIDTSLIASDNINNPNAMNSVFNVPQRVLRSFENPPEMLSAASHSQPSVWSDAELQGGQVPEVYQQLIQNLQQSNDNPRYVPRILLDGADSIGAWGALARVYLNIGTYYEQWMRLHRTVVGFDGQKPFTIDDCERHSVYWHATQARVAALRDYFLKITPPMPVLVAGEARDSPQEHWRLQPVDETQLRRRAKDQGTDYHRLLESERAKRIDINQLKDGRRVFARNCIVCHSSIQPESEWAAGFAFADPGMNQDQQSALPVDRDEHEARRKRLAERRRANFQQWQQLGEFWDHDPGQWLRDPDYIRWAEAVVENENFWRFNYLSTDFRIPVNLVQTNAGRAMATNAMDGTMWDDFASESYQRLPSVGAIEFFNPYREGGAGSDLFTPRHLAPPGAPRGGGGPGFYRVPTLVSIWTTAPLLHNNSLGLFNNDPSVDGRLAAFDDAIRKLLWPERRLQSSSYNGATPERLKQDNGLIWRTTEPTYLTLSARRLPHLLASEIPVLMRIGERYPWLREIHPIWLPSGILLIGSFLMLVAYTNRQKRLIGLIYLLLVVVAILLKLLRGSLGWFAWVDAVQPYWLPIVLLLLLGIAFLMLGSKQRSAYPAYAALAVGLIGLLLWLVGDRWSWTAWLQSYVPLGWVGLLVAAAGLVFLLNEAARTPRYVIARTLVLVGTVAILGSAIQANLATTSWSEAIGPVWIYGLLLIAAAVTLWAPDPRERSRYVGYGALILSLTFALVVYFLDGRLGDLRIGPIPPGTPVNLLANVNPDAGRQALKQTLKVTAGTLAEIDSKNLEASEAQRLFRERIAPQLMEVNKCPDLVMDRGHYFEWFKSMTDEDKNALIELLKTF